MCTVELRCPTLTGCVRGCSSWLFKNEKSEKLVGASGGAGCVGSPWDSVSIQGPNRELQRCEQLPA